MAVGLLGMLFVAGCEMEAPRPPETFEEAEAISRRHNATPEGARYERIEILEHQKLIGIQRMLECFASVKNPDPTPFQMILAITASGIVDRVYLEHETNVSTCVRDDVLGQVLSPPPFAPFYQGLSMAFQLGEAEDRNPDDAVNEPGI